MSAIETLAPSSSSSSSSLEPKAKRRKIDPTIEEPEEECLHYAVVDGICRRCGSDMGNSYGRPFNYLAVGLRLSDEAVGLMKHKRSEIYFRKKKLHLVLDLDHTLIHGCPVSQLTDAEKYLIHEADSRDDLWNLKIPSQEKSSPEKLIKLRPFVREFLEKASELFEMYVYTRGRHEYAEYVVNLIDPLKIYFGHRVITRRDESWRKTLDFVLAEERGVIIVDDNREMWPDATRNLIDISRYDYFRQTGCGYGDSRSYAEEKTDESEEDGPLANVLKLLEEIHTEFFKKGSEEDLDSRDVRPLVVSMRP